MRKLLLLFVGVGLMTSCVSKKQYADLEARYKETNDLLNSATVRLNSCLEEKAALKMREESLVEQRDMLQTSMDNLTILTKKGAENLEKSLESLREKDLTINHLRDAVTRRDSVNLALAHSLKGVLGNINDEDIDIEVEKGVVYVSISDKLLFNSGSYEITDRAKEILGKVAKVVNNKPDFEFMVEGHTDNVPISSACFTDNWDLSTKRATSVVRMLQKDFGVDPKRMTAAGRGEYIPVASNDNADGRTRNRRTRIVVLPKLDQFYSMIKEGLRNPAIN